MDRTGVGWWYPTESRMGSFHLTSEMELEEHDSEDICFAPPASHIEKILRKDLHVNRPFPSFENFLF